MEYMKESQLKQTQHMILCCECGSATVPNASNMCVGCIRSKVDISDGIQKQAMLQFCKGCERYLQPPSTWVACALESRELMAICLKRLKGLAKVKLVDATFIWTEPHSKRIKVKLTIQKEVFGSTILQQVFVVEFVIQGQMCELCHRREAKDFWKAIVQVRQKVPHKKTFFYLEQLILKHNIHARSLRVKQMHDGLDFYYDKKEEARKLVDFLQSVVPCRYKTAQELISHDIHNNTYNYKHTFSVELVPICKDDIVCLPMKLSKSLGNIGQILVCYKVTNSLHLINPATTQVAEVSANLYWRSPFSSMCASKQLTDYTVLEMDAAGGGTKFLAKSRYLLADVYLMRTNEMGSVDQVHCRTHLGHVLNVGDSVFGFDFTNSNLNDEHLEKMKEDAVPNVVLVKKSFADKRKRKKARNWKLHGIAKDTTSIDPDVLLRDYDEFLDDIEEDKDFRQNINIYKNFAGNSAPSESDADDAPRIGLEEMLDELTLEDQDMASDSDSD
ncbi:60S ribosomal export protein NMD3-like [Rhopilema esculentum]|uniref:60S ribosomal export protein NMD3-like n=1 Tax=Rhopilema esculentum TaxID=499914 RepID=UPI0031CE6050